MTGLRQGWWGWGEGQGEVGADFYIEMTHTWACGVTGVNSTGGFRVSWRLLEEADGEIIQNINFPVKSAYSVNSFRFTENTNKK